MKYYLFIITLLSLLTLSTQAGHPHRSTHSHKHHTYSCGCCSYIQKVLVRYDHCNRPVYTNRYIPVRHTCSSKPKYTHHQRYRYSHSPGYRHHQPYYNRSYFSVRYGNSCNGIYYSFRR